MAGKINPLAFLCLMVLTCAVGCGGKKADQTVEQFPEAVQRIVGRWQGTIRFDKEKALKKLGKPAFEALQTIKMDIVFQEDGKMIMSADVVASNHSKHGEGVATWEVTQHEGDVIQIRSVDDSTKVEDNVVITFANNGKFSIPYKEVGHVEFQRVPQTASR